MCAMKQPSQLLRLRICVGTRRVGAVLGEQGTGGDVRGGYLEAGGGNLKVGGGDLEVGRGGVQHQRMYSHCDPEGLTQGLAQQQTS